MERLFYLSTSMTALQAELRQADLLDDARRHRSSLRIADRDRRTFLGALLPARHPWR